MGVGLVLLAVTAVASVGGYWVGLRLGRSSAGVMTAVAVATALLAALVLVIQVGGVVGEILIGMAPALVLLGWIRGRQLT